MTDKPFIPRGPMPVLLNEGQPTPDRLTFSTVRDGWHLTYHDAKVVDRVGVAAMVLVGPKTLVTFDRSIDG